MVHSTKWVAAVTAVAAAAVVASPSASIATSSRSKASIKAAVAVAKIQYAKYVKAQTPVTVPMLPKRPPRGLTLTIGTCPLAVCTEVSSGARTAAEKLGWKVTYLTSQLTPAGYQSTLNQIVAHPTQLVALDPELPNSFVSKQLKALRAKHIPIVEMSTSGTDEPSASGPVLATDNGLPTFRLTGELMADTVIDNAGASASTVFVTDPSFPTYKNVQAPFATTIEAAGGSVGVLDISSANVGTQVPQQVVSYVQSHPSVRYIAFPLSDLDAGVGEALKAAGITGVKIIDCNPSPTTLANIINGTEWASVAEETSAGGFRTVDQLARLYEGVPLGNLRNPVGWHQILISANITRTSSYPATPGSPATFLKAWHLR
jgi:ribose transport system substrate-binding protein